MGKDSPDISPEYDKVTIGRILKNNNKNTFITTFSTGYSHKSAFSLQGQFSASKS